ncbi:MAG TPA: DegV family protein [Trueperaceae bacterium]|nr:DegV family protein [Trueperaceae bacterium]
MLDRSPASTPPHAPKFDVVADGGLDAFPTLLNDVPFAPFTLNFGSASFSADELPRTEFFDKLRGGEPHPTTSQPAPEQYAVLYRAASRAVLAVTISEGLSGSLNAAEQAKALAPDASVTLHDSGTLSAAQAFQVHAAMTARSLGHDTDTAVAWMREVHAETELYFTIDTLEYLRRGGRLGRVQATLGAMLSLRPVVTVDKAAGTYTNVGRARSWLKAMDAVARQVATRFGAGTPLRAAFVYGEEREDAEHLQERLSQDHELLWSDVAPVGVALAVHTGPKAVGLAVAPGPWPWERH